MNLRQIIRNQKLINFDYKLIDFISEADQDKIKTGKKTGTDPHYWYKNTKTGKTISSTDSNAQRQNYVLATKEDVAKKDDKKRDKPDPVDDKDVEVNIDDEKRTHIDSELALVGLKPSEDDKNVFVDEKGKELMTIQPNGDVVPGDDIDDIPSDQQKKFVDAVDNINAELKRVVEPAEKDDERVDEPTDTKPQERVQGNITDESIDAVDGEQKDLALEGKAKAPGNPSSVINEIEIGYGMTMFSDNPDIPVEDVAEELYNRTKDTIIGKRNGEEKTRSACVAAAISAKRENVRTQEFLASEDMNPDSTEISHVWGSKESLQGTVDALEESGVEEVNGIPFEEYKDIILAGGAGANPTDTMITMIDSSKTPPKAIILHTSNKTSTSDIQSNSSPEKNIEGMIDAAKEMEEKGDLSPEESKKIIGLAEKTKKGLVAKQQEIESIVSSSFNNARDQVESGEYVKTLKTLSTGANPDAYWKMVVKRYSNSKNNFAVNVSDPPSRADEKKLADAYLNEMEYLATTTDEVAPPTKDMNNILARTALTEEDETEMNKLYQEQHDMQNKMRVQMNKTKEGFGDRVMAKTFMSRLHLDVAEGHAPGGIPPQYFELNMGHNKSDIKYDEEGQAYIKEAGKFYPIDIESGDVDKDAEPKKISQLNSGTTATVGNMETIAAALGYEIPPPPKDIDEKIRVGSIESAKSGPAGKAFIYGINVEGEEVIIGFQSVRPKDGKGTRHQDTIEWAKDFQSRLQLASARQAKQESEERPNESIRFLGNIVSETKRNSLHYHWVKAEDYYPAHYFIREINEGSLI